MYSKEKIKSKKQAPMFEKRTVVELSENEMANIDGGTSWVCFRITLFILTIS